MNLRRAILIGVLAACAHSQTVDEALTTMAPTLIASPQRSSDSLLSVALHDAVIEWRLPRPASVIIQASDIASPRVLPVLDSVRFFILDSAQIRELANHVGSVSYLTLGPLEFIGDSATVGIGTAWADRKPRGFARGGGCLWVYRKAAGKWARARMISCFDS